MICTHQNRVSIGAWPDSQHRQWCRECGSLYTYGEWAAPKTEPAITPDVKLKRVLIQLCEAISDGRQAAPVELWDEYVLDCICNFSPNPSFTFDKDFLDYLCDYIRFASENYVPQRVREGKREQARELVRSFEHIMERAMVVDQKPGVGVDYAKVEKKIMENQLATEFSSLVQKWLAMPVKVEPLVLSEPPVVNSQWLQWKALYDPKPNPYWTDGKNVYMGDGPVAK